jgi:hypothetical protein
LFVEDTMIPCLTLSEDQEAAAAQNLVCSHLVRACRDAMYELALDEQSDPNVRHKAIQTLKVIHKDWIQAQKAVAAQIATLRDVPSGILTRAD